MYARGAGKAKDVHSGLDGSCGGPLKEFESVEVGTNLDDGGESDCNMNNFGLQPPGAYLLNTVPRDSKAGTLDSKVKHVKLNNQKFVKQPFS